MAQHRDGEVDAQPRKAAASVGARDARWLTKMHDGLGRRLSAGVVLHTGALGDRVSAVQTDVL
jgi:2-keto-4-pentenoate hydratase